MDGAFVEAGRRRMVLAVLALCACGLAAGYAYSLRARPAPLDLDLGASPSASSPRGERDGVWVHVAGSVERPGLYRLEPGARVADAIEAAGGASSGADLDALNLAAKLSDGDKVQVGTPSAPGTATSASTLVDLNAAGEAELDSLPGIGPALARRIIAYRASHGGFRTVKDLLKVPGIGPGKFEEIEPLVRV